MYNEPMDKRDVSDGLKAFARVGFHAALCDECRVSKRCNRTLFGGPPPKECPMAVEHVIGDQQDEDVE